MNPSSFFFASILATEINRCHCDAQSYIQRHIIAISVLYPGQSLKDVNGIDQTPYVDNFDRGRNQSPFTAARPEP